MSNAKQLLVQFLQFSLVYAAMFLAYLLSTMLIDQTSVQFSAEEVSQAATAVFYVCFFNALIFTFMILRARWYGLKLVLTVALIYFGVETFMAQIETLYYNRALQMEAAVLSGLLAAGAVRALVFSPLAVLFLGKHKPPQDPINTQAPVDWKTGVKAVAGISLLYVLIYYLFGYFVAWQWEETRLFYTGSTAIKPFFIHFRDLFFREEPLGPLFQLFRGFLWALLAVLVVRMMQSSQWQAALIVGSTFVILLAFPLGLFPNPYFPEPVLRSHFYEITSSMLLFGIIAGWWLHRLHETQTSS